jgi:hypothetical protein
VHTIYQQVRSKENNTILVLFFDARNPKIGISNNLRGPVWSTLIRGGVRDFQDTLYSLVAQTGAINSVDDVIINTALKALQQTTQVSDLEKHFALAFPSKDGKTAARVKGEFVTTLVSGAAGMQE